MKRILPVLLALLIFLSLPVHAADGKLSASADASGDQVTLTLRLDNPGIVATRIFVQYDAAVLQLTNAQNGEVFPANNATFGKDYSLDPYTMLWDESLRRDNNTNSGTLCILTFAVKGSTQSGTTDVRFTVDKSSTFDVNLTGVAIANTTCVVNVPVTEPETPSGSVKSVAANDLSLLYKRSGSIVPVVTADSGVQYSVAYSGFDGAIISVDANGGVSAKKPGTTSVTVTVEDEFGNTQECKCTVTVKYAWWQVLIRIFLLGFLWY